MAEFDLLRKTELRIEKVSLKNANLNQIACSVADTLKIERAGVLVTDVQGSTLTIDILKGNINAYDIVAKRDELFERLSALPGVGITEETSICSEGMLGWVVLNKRKGRLALKRSERISKQILQRLSKRAIVFSTGVEVANGQVKDTNTSTIRDRLEAEGYSVTAGPTLKDDELLIAASLRQAIDDGYGLVITSGGVGAEEKDRTVEAVLALDPEAANPYICKFQKGTGRHHKDGVRIAIGEVGGSYIIALPGPNDEVKSGIDVLIEGLRVGLGKNYLAENVAEGLRKRLREKNEFLVVRESGNRI
ncbi:MAG: molybdopterin-binding protein [Thermodesulfobacteriota bacterium]